MTPYEQDVLLPTLRTLNRQFGAIHARLLALSVGKSERTAQYYLQRMERVGMVARPDGPRKGWAVGVQLHGIQKGL